MGEVVLEYDDLDRTQNSSSALNLSCICCEDSFSYLIHPEGDTDHFRAKALTFDKRYPAFTKPLGYLADVLLNDSLLFDEFKHVIIAVRGVPFASLTLEQLASGQAESILATQTETGPNDTIYTDVIPGTQHALVFAIPAVLADEIEMFYQSARVRHSVSSLICHALTGEAKAPTRIHANITGDWLEVVAIHNNSLKYVNHMRWYKPNDVIYYLAALLDNLNLGAALMYEFSGSAYKDDMHAHLVENLSIKDDQLIRSSIDDVSMLDLRTLGLCV